MSTRSRKAVPSHTEALAVALSAASLDDVDHATKRLALSYAAMLDADPEAIAKVGRHYLDCLGALGLTPAARAALAKLIPQTATAGSDDLSRLRQRKARPT
jgi:hypothetical protein